MTMNTTTPLIGLQVPAIFGLESNIYFRRLEWRHERGLNRFGNAVLFVVAVRRPSVLVLEIAALFSVEAEA